MIVCVCGCVDYRTRHFAPSCGVKDRTRKGTRDLANYHENDKNEFELRLFASNIAEHSAGPESGDF